MAVLFEMQTGEIELLRGLYLAGLQGGFGGVGYGAYLVGLGVPREREGAASAFLYYVQLDGEAVYGRNAGGNGLVEQGLGGHVESAVVERFAPLVTADEHLHAGLAGGLNHQPRPSVGLGDVHHEVARGVLDYAKLTVGHEILRETLFLVGHEPREVGLVLGVDPCHKLYVRAVGVGQVAVPGTAEVAVAPCPLLLSRRQVVAGHVEHPAARVVLIAALEVVLGVYGHV